MEVKTVFGRSRIERLLMASNAGFGEKSQECHGQPGKQQMEHRTNQFT